VKLTYTRDRIVECYIYCITVFHREESSVARIVLGKLYALFVLLDDTFDVHATFEESQILDEALQRYAYSFLLLPDFSAAVKLSLPLPSLLVIPLFCAAPQLYVC